MAYVDDAMYDDLIDVDDECDDDIDYFNPLYSADFVTSSAAFFAQNYAFSFSFAVCFRCISRTAGNAPAGVPVFSMLKATR